MRHVAAPQCLESHLGGLKMTGAGGDANGRELESSGGFCTHMSGAWTVVT